MSTTSPAIPKKRIDVIDALRGFALIGILLLHCTEHFELFVYPTDPPAWLQFLNEKTRDFIQFFFLGKSYAIFSMLFGLSFFIQMENQADRGVDFRWRFAWRLALLFLLGLINGMIYSGEIFVVYAVLGLLLIPCYKLPVRWLWPLCLLLLLKLPLLIRFIGMCFDADLAAVEMTESRLYWRSLLAETKEVYLNDSLIDVWSRNLWEGQAQKWLWYYHSGTILHIPGLFMAGLIIGKKGIHKDENRLVKYAKRAVVIGIPLYLVFYCLNGVVPAFGFSSEGARITRNIFNSYANLGMMGMLSGGFVLAYLRLGGRKILDYLTPVGRMSLTNYMLQSLLGTCIFYGFGLGLAPWCGQFYSGLIGLALCAVQIAYSRWWIRHYYYGPVEWLWRSATWLTVRTPFRRKTKA